MFNRLKKIFLWFKKGTSEGILITSIIFIVALSFLIKTGLGIFADSFIVFFLAIIFFQLLKKIALFFLMIDKFIPVEFIYSILAVIFFMFIIPYKQLSGIFIFIEIIIGAIVGLAIYNGPRKLFSMVLILSALGINIFIVLYCLDILSNPGIDNLDKMIYKEIQEIKVSDPSKEGNFNVKNLFYGSGWDKQRSEYSNLISIKTEPVDVTSFFPETSGFQNNMRRWIWGFDAKSFPINARVWYPADKEHCPLVIIVHGNYQMEISSDAGYEYLGKLLASRGFIVASIDENFLNEGWFGDYSQKENFTRAWILLKHLEYWKKWNEIPGNPFYNKVDMDKIALIGHSRGGIAVSLAASMNRLQDDYNYTNSQKFNFSIKSIVQIAPERPYNPIDSNLHKISNVNYLVLFDGYEKEVNYYIDDGFYENITYTGNEFYFKSALYLHGADQLHFNTVWEKKDLGNSSRWTLNFRSPIDGEKQRKTAMLYISAFLEVTLNNRRDYIPIFKNYELISELLPKDIYFSQYEDSKSKCIFNNSKDNEIKRYSNSGIRIESENVKIRDTNISEFNNGLEKSNFEGISYLKWNENNAISANIVPQYSIILSDSVKKECELNKKSNLFFFICSNVSDSPNSMDFSIELGNKDYFSKKIPLSQFVDISTPNLKEFFENANISKLASAKKSEKVFHYVEIPLKEFISPNNTFDISKVSEIRFLFDRTAEGEIILGKIGFN